MTPWPRSPHRHRRRPEVTEVRDDYASADGIQVCAARMTYLQDRVLERDPFEGEWTYALLSPGPPGTGARGEHPGRVQHDALNECAITGMQPLDLESLAAVLEIPFAVHREQQYYTRRGGRSVEAVRKGGAACGTRRLDVTDHILAARLRGHLNLPAQAIGVLLGVDGEPSAARPPCRRAPRRRTHPAASHTAAARRHPPHPSRTPAIRCRGRQHPHHRGQRPDHGGTLQRRQRRPATRWKPPSEKQTLPIH